jgi:glycosyltransferase involved in cell wall biosynthesis
MKVSIGMHLQDGPWGGGNQFGHSLVSYLQDKGASVYFDLSEPAFDIILMTASRHTAAYGDQEILKYLRHKNPHTIVVHRVNECDERKGTTGVNRALMRANRCADHTVFISSWLRDLFISQHGMQIPEHSVILNGADSKIFNPVGYRRWDGKGKLKFVTHHWGAHPLKGFDIYEQLDRMLGQSAFSDRVDFTYIGNLPEGFRFNHARQLDPQSGTQLADSIRQHHVYLTASQNEPAGMHHIEGARCGLPILYRESGALPEYCAGYGISFTAENFERKLLEMLESYDKWADRMSGYPHTAERSSAAYYDLFVQLLDRRTEIYPRRNLPRPEWWSELRRRLPSPLKRVIKQVVRR